MTTVLAPSITSLWQTPIWLDNVTLGLNDDTVSALLAEPAAGGCVAVDPARILTKPAQARTLFMTALRDIVATELDAQVTLTIELHSTEHGIALQYSRSAWQGRHIIASTSADPQSASGMLSLHDPRAGCAAVSVPGLPWGRPLTVKAHPGLTVLHPGWLAYSTTPLAVGHRLLVLSAALDLPSTHQGQQ